MSVLTTSVETHGVLWITGEESREISAYCMENALITKSSEENTFFSGFLC